MLPSLIIGIVLLVLSALSEGFGVVSTAKSQANWWQLLILYFLVACVILATGKLLKIESFAFTLLCFLTAAILFIVATQFMKTGVVISFGIWLGVGLLTSAVLEGQIFKAPILWVAYTVMGFLIFIINTIQSRIR